MADKQVDILIVGGGLTGATLLLALQGAGFSTLLIDAHSLQTKITADFDARSLALSPSSQRILNSLGVWSYLKEYTSPIEHIHVSEQQRFGAARLQGEKNQALGYVVEMQYLHTVLHPLLLQEQTLTPATLSTLDLVNKIATVRVASEEMKIQFQVLVAADGSQSVVRQLCALAVERKDYQQEAIVANVALMKPHGQRAFERFTPEGPLALLPMQGNRMSLVWAMRPGKAKQLMSTTDTEFLRELQHAFGYRLGRFTKIGRRFIHPLKQAIMPSQVQWPVVFIGNAAHTLHPVAGQGFNLGLRDVAMLAQCITRYGLNEAMMHEYARLRIHDQHLITQFTDGLIHLFTSRIPGIALARNIGLLAFDMLPAVKKRLARHAQGFNGVIPDLVCDIALAAKET